MTYYWVLFSISSLLAILPLWRPGTTRATYIALGIGLLLTISVGFRYLVGGDWAVYEIIFREANNAGLVDAVGLGDPAYYGLNAIVGQFGGDIWHVNLVCAAIFTYGLIRFCSTLPYPAVGLLASVPYLVIVVGMGFTRQATAIGCLMAAMAIYDGRLKPGVIIWFVLALAFHKSVIFGVLVFVFSSTRNRTLNIVIGGIVLLLLVAVFLVGNVDRLLDIYIETELQSGGATVRLLLSWLITGAYFVFLDRSGLLGARYKLWRNMALFSLALIPAYLYSTSSTAVDRVGFVLLPFQVMVFGYLPVITRKRPVLTYPLIAAIVGFNFAVLYIWLFLADNALYWIPYRNVLLEPYLRVF
jgi:hypothetical protein